MFANPADDWRALTENYRSMSDEQLCELAESFADLTPIAQQVLRDEMKLRKLGDPQAPVRGRDANDVPASADIGDGSAVEYTWKTLLCQCDSPEEAWQIAEVLRRAGIESWIEGPRSYAYSSGSEHTSLDVGSQSVRVAADQLDEARIIISRPIPQEIVEESQATAPEYEPPVCPQCGAADPVLENTDPVNEWKCESCGAEWVDEETEEEPAG